MGLETGPSNERGAEIFDSSSVKAHQRALDDTYSTKKGSTRYWSRTQVDSDSFCTTMKHLATCRRDLDFSSRTVLGQQAKMIISTKSPFFASGQIYPLVNTSPCFCLNIYIYINYGVTCMEYSDKIRKHFRQHSSCVANTLVLYKYVLTVIVVSKLN